MQAFIDHSAENFNNPSNNLADKEAKANTVTLKNIVEKPKAAEAPKP